MRISALLLALAAFVLFVALGTDVVRHGEPEPLLAWERSLVNHSTLVAWWLTWGCYAQVLVPVAVALAIVAWRVPEWRARIIFGLVMLLICWRGADLAQHLFARPRRLDWVVKHERSFSYPSSHAAIATGFYGLLAGMLFLSELPRRVRVTTGSLLVILALAICWSRLALAAHYFTDLIGGALLAVAIVAAGLAVAPGVLRGPVAGRDRRAEE